MYITFNFIQTHLKSHRLLSVTMCLLSQNSLSSANAFTNQ